VGWLRQCANWLIHLQTREFPPVVNLRPEGDHPDRAHVVAALPRVAAIVQRIAADVDELARARRVADLGAAAALPDRRAERRRRVAVIYCGGRSERESGVHLPDGRPDESEAFG
jgi:hypothetical protein